MCIVGRTKSNGVPGGPMSESTAIILAVLSCMDSDFPARLMGRKPS